MRDSFVICEVGMSTGRVTFPTDAGQGRQRGLAAGGRQVIDAQTLQHATGCTAEAARTYAPLLDEACSAYGINTPARLAAFLAQIGHESGSLRFTSEVWGPTAAQARYEGRSDLGNTEPGDGSRYRGRGLIQTTGRYNYRQVRDRLRARGLQVPDFEADPEALAHPRWAAWSAADYWDSRSLNALADAGDFLTITRRINGGTNGLADRERRWELARSVLGATAARPAPIESRPVPQDIKPEPSADKERNMSGAGLLFGLARSVIDVFTPLAKEKITKEIGRHTDRPEVAQQMTDAIIGSVKAATGKDDPIEAVAAARADPAIVQQVERAALEDLAKLAPMLDKVAEWDRLADERTEASRAAADARARMSAQDQDPYLTRAIVRIMVGVLIALAAMIGVMTYFDKDVQVLVGLFAGLVGAVAGKFNTRYDHRYGTSASSAAKDAVIDRMATTRRP